MSNEKRLDTTIYIDVETTGLNAYTDRLTCIGMIIEVDGDIKSIHTISYMSEHAMLKEFFKFYDRYAERIMDTVTWNKTFDSDFILVRGWIHKFKNFIPVNSIDLKDEFPAFNFDGKWRKPSLDEAAELFKLKLKKLSTGADAPYMWKYGLIDQLKKYCIQDVEILRELNIELEKRK